VVAGVIALIILAGVVSSCAWPSPGDDADDIRVGPWVESDTSRRFEIDTSGTQPIRVEITNLLGSVSLLPSESGEASVAVTPVDGRLPKNVIFGRSESGVYGLKLLDSPDAGRSTRPECPKNRIDGGVERLGYRLPRVNVRVFLPSFAEVEVLACSDLRIAVDADVRARCGSLASILAGYGLARIESPELVVESCTYDVVAAVSGKSTFSNADGDKWLRGSGDVTITGGGGVLDIAVGGKVFVDGAISGGYAPVASPTGPSSEDLAMIGPARPFAASRQPNRDLNTSASRISAPDVEVRVPVSCHLEVRLRVNSGQAETYFPSRDKRVVPHEMTTASAHFSIGTPKGELVIESETRGEIIVKPEEPTTR
jgi:hypothetical protein